MIAMKNLSAMSIFLTMCQMVILIFLQMYSVQFGSILPNYGQLCEVFGTAKRAFVRLFISSPLLVPLIQRVLEGGLSFL